MTRSFSAANGSIHARKKNWPDHATSPGRRCLRAHPHVRPEHGLCGRHDRGDQSVFRSGPLRGLAAEIHLHVRGAGLLGQAAAVAIRVMQCTDSTGAKASYTLSLPYALPRDLMALVVELPPG